MLGPFSETELVLIERTKRGELKSATIPSQYQIRQPIELVEFYMSKIGPQTSRSATGLRANNSHKNKDQ